MQLLEKKRPKEEKDVAQRLKPLAKLQTADDYDSFVDGIICEIHFLYSSLTYSSIYCRGIHTSQKDTGVATLSEDGP